MHTCTSGAPASRTAEILAWAAMPEGAGGDPDCGNILTDRVLMHICRVTTADPQVTPDWLAILHQVARLVGHPQARQGLRLESALTLLTSVLAQLEHFNPTHLPFGYGGPRVQSYEWVEREALEQVGKQIVGLIWRSMCADAVAGAVREAVTVSVRVGFLDQKQYDTWRPGMKSGSGWRPAISATPYGVLTACSVAAPWRAQEGPAVLTISGATSGAGYGVSEADTGAASAQEKPTTPDPIDGPAVQLGRPGEPCVVLGKQKKPLTDGQYAIVSALVKAGDEGMTKDQLEVVRPSARRILKKLREDADWAQVILMPGQTNGRYRVKGVGSTCVHL